MSTDLEVNQEGVIGFNRHSNKHAAGISPEAQGAFKGLMTREILQFALRIAFRCVLHRCGSQEVGGQAVLGRQL